MVERDSLKETNEELTMAQMQQGSSLASMGVGEGESLAGGLDLMNMPPEAKSVPPLSSLHFQYPGLAMYFNLGK